LVRLALMQINAAKENLRVVLQATPGEPRREWLETLAAVRDSGHVHMTELAEWVGVSRSKLYELLSEADERKGDR
jgi:DNA-binding phage protein